MQDINKVNKNINGNTKFIQDPTSKRIKCLYTSKVNSGMIEIANIYLRELLNNKQIDNDDNICLATGEKCMLHYQPMFKRIVFSAYGSDFELAISQDLITPLLFDLKASTLNGNRVYYITIHNRIFTLNANK